MTGDLQQRFDALERQRRSIEHELQAFSEPQLGWAPTADTWSLLNEVEHLLLVDQAVLAQMESRERHDWSPEARRRNGWRVPFVVVWSILWLGIRVPVPDDSVVPTGTKRLVGLLEEWENARRRMADLLEGIEYSRLAVAVHPVSGPMAPSQLLSMLLIHGRYHKRHMQSLYRSPAFPPREIQARLKPG